MPPAEPDFSIVSTCQNHRKCGMMALAENTCSRKKEAEPVLSPLLSEKGIDDNYVEKRNI